MLLEMRGITKRFPGVIALKSVDFDLRKGEIHALVGENGAGKSTLIKILSGVHQPDEGEIILRGKKVRFRSTIDALRSGIATIYQELTLSENLPVYANIFLGMERSFWNIGASELKRKTRELFEELEFDLDPEMEVGKLTVSERQMISVAKALVHDAEIIIMDEPTATLTEREVERLFEIMKNLRSRGVSVIFISHRLDEVFEVADRVTVLRDGEKVGSGPISEFSRDDLIRLMVGREIKEMYPKYNEPEEEIIFEVEDFEVPGKVSKLSFSVRKGEIFGVAGLVGSGKSYLGLGLFGGIPSRFSRMVLKKKEISEIRNPVDALKSGIVLIPEDRKLQGLVLDLTVLENLTLPNADRVSRFMRISWRAAKKMAREAVKRFRIKTPTIFQRVKNLSGGNQQKVVIGKFMFREPDLVILSEPTRGIDVGAKVEVYKLMNDLAKNGKGIVFISSELPEIVSLCDRVMVLHRGEMTALLESDEITQENILKAATGVDLA